MFAAAPPLIGMLIRYWLMGETLKFVTGTTKKDLAKAALDLSEQIGDVYTSALARGDPNMGLAQTIATGAAGVLGAPGTIAEAAGYTFEGEFARQRQRLASEIGGGFPTTQVRIKGAPKFAKRKLSSWNRQVKAGMKLAKANPKIWPPKMPGTRLMEMVTKDLSKLNKGKKAQTKKQKKLKLKLKPMIDQAIARWKAR
jgi:hypothetical protein